VGYKLFVQCKAITGCMIGLEFLWEARAVVFDLGIVRVFVGFYKVKK